MKDRYDAIDRYIIYSVLCKDNDYAQTVAIVKAYTLKLWPQYICKKKYISLNKIKRISLESLSYGIYCIKLHGQIIYIGMCFAECFNERWESHKRHFIERDESLYLYKKYYIVADELEYEIMLDCSKADMFIDYNSLQRIEYSFIQYFKPEGNQEGSTIPYHARHLSDEDKILENYKFFWEKIKI